MDAKIIRKIIQEASQHGLQEIIPSTMGEPLLYEGFEYILSLCHEFNVKLNLTTNGTFPRKTVTEWARLIVPITSDVKISWNGSTSETTEAIMKGIKFEKIIENIKEFIRVRDEVVSSGGNRCRITFQITFLETNINDLPQVIRLASEIGVDRVKGHHLWVHFDQIQHLSMRRSPEAISRWNQAVDSAIIAAERYRLPSGEKVLLENIFHLDPSTEEISQEAVCPFLDKEVWVSAQGRFNPCCAPDELRQTLGEFGNLKEKRLMDIWTGPTYKKLTKTYLTNNLCRTCNMRRPLSNHLEDSI
jgi:MoaA/NifB/PqqE/SkfB family radical SAM enzyme